MKKNTRLMLLGGLLLVACLRDECRADRNQSCNCQAVADPVCGCDGLTYGNACEAECAGIETYTNGSCPQ